MIEIIPNWHPVFVHFTVALLAIAAILFLVVAVAGRDGRLRGIETAAGWNLWLGAAVTMGTLAAGLQAAGSVVHDEPAHVAMLDHRNWAFATAALFVALALWNVARVRRGTRVGPAFAIALLVGLVGIGGTGLRGADLVFGHGLGVRSLPKAGGHSHEGGAEHSHDEGAEHEHDDEAPAGAPPSPAPEATLPPGSEPVIAALVAYHDALTSGDVAAPEAFVLADERFVMIEGKHVNRGWADYRDHHLKEEIGDLAKVRFRLSGYQVQMSGDLAAVSFLFNILPRSGPEMDFGSGRATAVLVRTGAGWKLQELHTS
jgi:uncharacterized membrane protein